MNKSEGPTSTPAAMPELARMQKTDYAAWLDNEGREHLITRDMVDAMIAELISGTDYSLQGRAITATGNRQVLTNSPPLG